MITTTWRRKLMCYEAQNSVTINRKGGGALDGVAEAMDTCPKKLSATIHCPLE